MTPEPSKHLIHICTAFILALCLHVLLLLILENYSFLKKDHKSKTVPTVLLTNGSKASLAMQQSRQEASNSAAAKAYLATLEASSFKIQTDKNKFSNNQIFQKRLQPKNKTLKLTPPSDSMTKQSQTSRARKANQGFANIFKKQKTIKEIKQITSKKNEVLSDYEISLRSILSRAVFYDQFHKFIAAKGNKPVNFEVTLTLLPSGAIKNAKITRSSGIKEIDILVKQNTYRASPYPRPPAEDMQKGFKYSISITHQQVSNDG